MIFLALKISRGGICCMSEALDYTMASGCQMLAVAGLVQATGIEPFSRGGGGGGGEGGGRGGGCNLTVILVRVCGPVF